MWLPGTPHFSSFVPTLLVAPSVSLAGYSSSWPLKIGVPLGSVLDHIIFTHSQSDLI